MGGPRQSLTDDPARLTPASLYRSAFGTLRARPGRVLPVAAAVGVLSSVLDLAAERIHGGEFAGARLVVVVVLVTSASVFGTTFLAGVFDVTVAEHQHGRDAPELRHLHRDLPWASLIIADAIISVARGLALLVAIIPTLVVVTLTCITGPVVMIERGTPIAAIRRSVQLLWPHFWLALIAISIPLALETGLVVLIEAIHPPAALHLVLLLGVETPFSTLVALAEVSLAYALVFSANPTDADAG